MSKKSFLGRLGDMLKEPEEETAEDIDREVLSAVNEIMETEVSTLDGGGLLGKSEGDDASRLFIVSLTPIYDMIGDRQGRLAMNLRETCNQKFWSHVEANRGVLTITGELMLMRLFDLGEAKGFQLAAAILNDIGDHFFGDRFLNMNIGGMLSMADAADVANEDGTLNLKKTREIARSGGVPVAMDDPGEDAPQWLKLIWKAQIERKAILVEEKRKQKARAVAKRARQKALNRLIPRKLGERRKQFKAFKGDDQRQGLDRRGRGY